MVNSVVTLNFRFEQNPLISSKFEKKKGRALLHIRRKERLNSFQDCGLWSEAPPSPKNRSLLKGHSHLGLILLCFADPLSLKNWFTNTDGRLWMRRLLCPLRQDACCAVDVVPLFTELYFPLTTPNKLIQSFMATQYTSWLLSASWRYAQHEMRSLNKQNSSCCVLDILSIR